MYILGISAFYHDSAAVLIKDGDIVAAAQEERFTRKKHDPGFPVNAIRYCLEEGGVSLDELAAVAFYDKPLLKFERLLETYYSFSPRGLMSFITSMPVWIKEKMFLKREIHRGLASIGAYDKSKMKLLFPEHHLSHAASTFYVSPFKKAAIITIDGVGEWATASICLGEDNKITVLKELRFPHSLGLLYSSFTYFLGFRVNSGEYKLMGLAPYGDPASAEVAQFVKLIKDKLIRIYPDGSIWLNQSYFNYATGLEMTRSSAWEKLFGIKKRNAEDELTQEHCNLGLAIQQVTEEVVVAMAKEAKRLTGAEYLCLAGGVALNCVANGKVQDAALYQEIFITPASGDAGGALGAALAAWHIHFDKGRTPVSALDNLRGSYLGPDTTEHDVVATIKKYKARATKFDTTESLVRETAALLSEGNVVGWVQGRMEFGPRALGARSILGDPRNAEMQKKLNLKIKYRESFRPFAPSVLSDKAQEYFEMKGTSPYMLLVRPVKQERRAALPIGYQQLGVREKLYYLRSDLPSITHIDFSARVQTVHRETNERYYRLIEAFQKLTGIAVLVNTSFNVRGEPIVCSAEHAYRCFMRTEMDYLVLGDYLLAKKDQPEWNKTDNWKEEFVLD
jgi:carbamoyltransferase